MPLSKALSIRACILLVIALAVGQRAHAQSASTLPLDSIRALPDDTVKLRRYLDYILPVRQSAGKEASLAWLREALPLGRAAGATQVGFDHRRSLVRELMWNYEPDSALAYSRGLRPIARALGRPRALADTEDAFAIAYQRLGQGDSAAIAALNAHRLYSEIGMVSDAAYELMLLGEIRADLDDRTGALDYLRQAFELSAGGDRDVIRQIISKEYARGLLRVGRIDEARAVADTCLSYARRLDDPGRIRSALHLRITILKADGRLADARQVYDELRQANGGKLSLSERINYAALRARMGDSAGVRDTLLKLLPVYGARGNNVQSLLSIYSMLAFVDLSGARYDSARLYFDKHAALQDSIKGIKNQERVLELEQRFAAAERDAEIALQGSQLTTQRRTLWGVGLLLVLALAAVGIVAKLASKLRRKSTENEFLVKEIHHRVKNNLQVLSSLLYLQGRHLARDPSGGADPDGHAAAAIQQSQTRVEAMGLIHQQLYTRDRSVAEVNMPTYLRELGETLLDTFGGVDGCVQIAYAVEDIPLDVDTAIPLGLIVNELVTNSMKYAFPAGQPGTIEIELRRDGPKRLLLRVSDDGEGADEGDAPKGTGFGGSLVELLSKKLGGEPKVLAMVGGGYATELSFEQG